jgi:beta-lactam-binding protein with PASTA domain
MNSESSLKNLLINTLIVTTLGIGLILGFFYIYLPSSTNHMESITVPNLEGITMDELDEFLVKRGLRYEVSDSAYSDKHPALTILKQYPKAGAKVKENRKVFISVNRVNPPTVPMPDLIDGPLKNAQVVLTSNELKIGEISFKPDLAFNAVLEQRLNGEPIKAGTKIHKGSVIDLVVGNGYGNRNLKTPNLISYPFDEAQYYIKGIQLQVGEIRNAGDSLQASGYIYKQIPEPESNIRLGQSVDLWVVPTYDTTQFEYFERIFAIQDSIAREE